MTEHELQQKGFFIESVNHLHGSPCGQYWGYLVVERNGAKYVSPQREIFHGRSITTMRKSAADAFTFRRQALKRASKLAGEKPDDSEEHNDDYGDDDPWIDIGGEG